MVKGIRYFAVAVVAAACFTSGLLAQESKEAPKPAAAGQEQPKPEEDKVTGTGSIGAFSQYIFRGYEYSKSSMVIQPSLSASYKGFTASFWGNIDTDEHATQNFVPDRPGRKSFNETDLTLSYTYALDKWNFTGGYIYYDTKYAPETEEFFLTVAYDIIGKPTFTVFRDFTAYPGWYFNFSLSHSFAIYKDITLDLGASAGYELGTGGYWDTYQASTGSYAGSKYSGFHDGMVKVGFTIPVTKKFTIQPVGQYWFPLSSEAKRKTDGNSYNPSGYLRNRLVGGVSFSYNF